MAAQPSPLSSSDGALDPPAQEIVDQFGQFVAVTAFENCAGGNITARAMIAKKFSVDRALRGAMGEDGSAAESTGHRATERSIHPLKKSSISSGNSSL